MDEARAPFPPSLAGAVIARRSRRRRRAVAALLLAACTLPALAQRAPAAADGEELIAVVRTNGVRRGEFTLLRRPDHDFWIAAEDLAALQLEPQAPARRELAGRTYYSARTLGARKVDFDEALLTLSIDFAPEALQQNVIDVAARRARVPLLKPLAAQGTSLILSYRLSALDNFETGSRRALVEDELAVRLGPLLLRQESTIDTAAPRRFLRGASQAIWDDVPNARRWTFGDVVSTAGAYGSTITGGGLLLAKFYDLTPDVLRNPVATINASTPLPAQVELSVDGNTIYRTQVGPGPLTLTNVAIPGGRQNVRLVVTDVSGRRQVIEQPFFFTDAALGAGFHEYSYFAGKRSALGPDGERTYLEPAWQGFHRYGVTNNVTVSGGGEGTADFTSGGAGLTLRSDRLGLLSADLLASADRVAHKRAAGWAARYTYLLPTAAFQVSRRAFGDGFRSFAGNGAFGLLRKETRIAASTQWGRVGLSADLGRIEFATERRDTAVLRAATRIARNISLTLEYQRERINGVLEWSASVFMRAELDGQRWITSILRASQSGRGLDLETGKPLPAGEGFGYRVGTSATTGPEGARYAYGGAEWALRAGTLDGFLSLPANGRGPSYGQVGFSGAIAAVDGYWGATRRISDSFAVASLGAPQAGVEILLNNQVQGRTDARGRLFIPQVGAFGQQELGVNDRQLDMQYTLTQKVRSIAPSFRSGTLVEFGARRMRAVAGNAWILGAATKRPVELRAWTMQGAGTQIRVQTGRDGDFYLEDVTPGRFRGELRDDQGAYSCAVTIPDFQEPVLELAEGILCE